MAVWQGRPVRKMTGGRYRDYRKRKKYEAGSVPIHTKIGNAKTKVARTRGGNTKIKVLVSDVMVVYDPKTKTSKKAKIITVKENNANPHFVHRNIMTKGAIVQTEIGMAKITSRPGQHGVINGILVQ
jgi:small subunit ribosomal protein S8e